MRTILSPPQETLLNAAGLLAVEPNCFAGLRMWADRIHVVVAPLDRHRKIEGIMLILDQATAAAWSDNAPVPEPAIIGVGGKRIGVLDVIGFLTKSDSPGRAGLVTLRSQLRGLVDDGQVNAVLLRIDSPGGTVAGTADLAAEITRARKSLPVFAYVEDLAAASAYWIASQAEKVYANTATCLVGEIGTFVSLYDRSRQFGKAGVKAIVLRAGEFKTVGFPGTEITDKQRSYLQDLVDRTQAEFNKAISGRKINPAAIASGKAYLAGDAVKLGLIDGVKTIDNVLAELANKTK